MEMQSLITKLRSFAKDRNWEQFHNPKNLVMALSNEVGELTEIFQWLTSEQSQRAASNPETLAKIREELADVFLYLIRLSDVLGVDLHEAASHKFSMNEKKYPIEKSKGLAEKLSQI